MKEWNLLYFFKHTVVTMNDKGSLPTSQQPDIGPYCEPYEIHSLIFLIPILMLSSHLRLDLPSDLCRFYTEFFFCISHLYHACCMITNLIFLDLVLVNSTNYKAPVLKIVGSLKVQCGQGTRKWGFKRMSSPFLCDYPAFPRQWKCWRSVIPSRQFLYMHTFTRILLKDNTNLLWFITGAEIDPLLLANMPRIA
jgi:hypothetical protein